MTPVIPPLTRCRGVHKRREVIGRLLRGKEAVVEHRKKYLRRSDAPIHIQKWIASLPTRHQQAKALDAWRQVKLDLRFLERAVTQWVKRRERAAFDRAVAEAFEKTPSASKIARHLSTSQARVEKSLNATFGDTWLPIERKYRGSRYGGNGKRKSEVKHEEKRIETTRATSETETGTNVTESGNGLTLDAINAVAALLAHFIRRGDVLGASA